MTADDGGLRQRLGELSALVSWRGNQAAATAEAAAYGDARALTEHDGSRGLAREVGRLRAAWQATPEHRAFLDANREYQGFVAAHEPELARPEPPPATADQWHERLREREREVERTAPLVEDPSRPAPWDHQLALDDLQGFLACCPEPEEEAEAGG